MPQTANQREHDKTSGERAAKSAIFSKRMLFYKASLNFENYFLDNRFVAVNYKHNRHIAEK